MIDADRETIARLAGRFSGRDARANSAGRRGSWCRASRCTPRSSFSKTERQFDLLVDITCVDYLNYRDADRSLRAGLSAGLDRDQRAAHGAGVSSTSPI